MDIYVLCRLCVEWNGGDKVNEELTEDSHPAVFDGAVINDITCDLGGCDTYMRNCCECTLEKKGIKITISNKF